MDVSRSVLHQTYHLPDASNEARAVDDVLQRCLAKDPSMRFASADALRQALIPALRRVVS
jgi:serine/threonine protein kinase